MQEPVDLAIDETGLARVTLNRPKRANSIDPEMSAALLAALEACEADPSVRVLLLQASGRNFCAGVDLAWMKQVGTLDYEDNLRDALHVAWLLHRLNTMRMPTLAVIPGRVVGLGVGIVAACDIAIAVESASFRLSEVRLGIIPAVISPYVIAAMGPRASRRYFLTAEAFDAAEAHRIGFVHAVCGDGDLDAAAAAMTAELLAGKPQAQAAAKRLIEEVRQQPLSEALIADTATRLAETRRGQEAQDALAAFLKK